MKKYKYIGTFLLLLVFSFAELSITVCADTGPKPSVVIHFKGIEKETYYVTLLSEEEESGPWGMEDGFTSSDVDQVIFDKFKNYRDEDYFHFIGFVQECSENDTFKWEYYPPDIFKILIYFPENDQLVCSKDVCERYAFDSYYTVDASNIKDVKIDETSENADLVVEKSYDFAGEISYFILRILFTLIIELGIGLLYGYRSKIQILILFICNIATQIMLNVMLNIMMVHCDASSIVANYICLEILVFIIEGTIYSRTLQRFQKKKENKSYPWLYAFTANVASFLLGFWGMMLISLFNR